MNKSENDFYKASARKDGLQTYCKECNKTWIRTKYKQNTNYFRTKRDNVRKLNRRFVWDYLSKNPCTDCGQTDPIVLEFDHRNPNDKLKCVSEMMDYSLRALEEEIEKCDVVCANCHRKRTAKQLNYYSDII